VDVSEIKGLCLWTGLVLAGDQHLLVYT